MSVGINDTAECDSQSLRIESARLTGGEAKQVMIVCKVVRA